MNAIPSAYTLVEKGASPAFEVENVFPRPEVSNGPCELYFQNGRQYSILGGD